MHSNSQINRWWGSAAISNDVAGLHLWDELKCAIKSHNLINTDTVIIESHRYTDFCLS